MIWDYLPEKLQDIKPISLYASLIWLTLIILMMLILLFLKPLKNSFTGKSSVQSVNQETTSDSKGFKSN